MTDIMVERPHGLPRDVGLALASRGRTSTLGADRNLATSGACVAPWRVRAGSDPATTAAFAECSRGRLGQPRELNMSADHLARVHKVVQDQGLPPAPSCTPMPTTHAWNFTLALCDTIPT